MEVLHALVLESSVREQITELIMIVPACVIINSKTDSCLIYKINGYEFSSHTIIHLFENLKGNMSIFKHSMKNAYMYQC